MRDIFIEELVLSARKNEKIFLIVGDLGFSVVEKFSDEFPDRFLNAGVAEQNMAGIAAGMASEGYHVFIYSIANFPTFRCAEQIRNDIAYHNLNVTIVSVGGGVVYGALGYSHHAVQDYALMRTFPNMTIVAPGDVNETRAAVKFLVDNPGPSYLRLGNLSGTHSRPLVVGLTPGQWLQVKKGNTPSLALVSTGAALDFALALGKTSEFKSFSIHSLPVWSMSVKDVQFSQLINFSTIYTVEDHLQDGGFGSWMLEAKASNPAITCDIRNISLSSQVTDTVGTQQELRNVGGLSIKKLNIRNERDEF